MTNEEIAIQVFNEATAGLMERGMSTFEIADLWRDKIEPGLRQPFENPADNAPPPANSR